MQVTNKSVPILVFIFLLFIISLTSCVEPPSVLGKDLIVKAKKDYNAVDSARLQIINCNEDKVIQDLSFIYDGQDMTFLYSVLNKNDEYDVQYYTKEFTKISIGGEITTSNSCDENYVRYTREAPHPLATSEFMAFSSSKQTNIETTYDKDVQSITYSYNPKDLGMKASDSTETIIGYHTTYNYDKDGLFLSLLETTDLKKEDGSEYSTKILVEITQRNEITEIKNPFDE